MKRARVLLAFLAFVVPSFSVSSLELQKLAEGLTAPIDLADPNDGSGRLFVVEQQGVVSILDNAGALSDQPLLDLRSHLLELEEGFEERGLLGFALHPDFNQNGRLYVSYAAPLRDSAPSGWNYTRRISELTLAPGAERVELGTERVLIELDWPSRKHNGGGLAFGPDGFLYIGLGDGGGAHGVGKEVLWSAFDVPKDQLYWDRLAQDTTSLFGSILRIDVDGGFPSYGIPASNPFVGKAGRDEIYAFGFRNPYRLSFDSLGTGDFLVTAIAETLWEAIYLVSSPGNFGWPIREGTRCVDRASPRKPPSDCPRHGPNGSLIQQPIVEYPNMQVMHPDTEIEATGVGTAVVGGRIYRGKALPDLEGKLIFGDWSAAFERPSGQLFLATPPDRWRDLWSFEKLKELDTRIISLAEDADGEVYILTNDQLGPFGDTGQIFKLVPSGDG
jgi:glucose/arabinose dehydrogenase